MSGYDEYLEVNNGDLLEALKRVEKLMEKSISRDEKLISILQSFHDRLEKINFIEINDRVYFGDRPESNAENCNPIKITCSNG